MVKKTIFQEASPVHTKSLYNPASNNYSTYDNAFLKCSADVSILAFLYSRESLAIRIGGPIHCASLMNCA